MNRLGKGILMIAAAMTASAEITLEEKEAFLRTAKVVERKGLSMGVTNSQKATMTDGTLTHAAHVQTVDISKASFQTAMSTELNFRDSYKYNVAAYELAKMLGLTHMVPPSIERKVGGGRAAVTWWVDEVAMTELDRYKKKIAPPDPVEWARQMNIVHTFDQLIYNTDRNLGNLVITKDWKIWMIDHTRAFRWRNECQNLKMITRVDENLLAKMRELTKETLQARVGDYLSKMEIESLLTRRDKLVQHVEKLIAQRGAAQVLNESGN